MLLILPFLLLVAAPLVARAEDSPASAKVTSIFIDTVSGYDELSTCAEEVLSTIVRAQYSGCGDKGAVTSYTCFCTDSSSLMSDMITQAVSNRCDSSIISDQASSAIDVFDAYCAIGVPGDLATRTTTAASTASGTASASPASTASTTAASATPVGSGSASSTPTSTPTPSSPMSRSKVVAIAVGISVPCGIIAISLIACLVWCRRRRQHEQLRSEKRQQLESTSQAAGVGSSRPEFRWPARIAGTTQELATQYHSHEMPAKAPMTSPSNSDYHISPLPTAPAPQKQPAYQVQSEKIPYQHQEFYQPLKKAQDQQQEPQELPAGIEDRHELEGSPSPLSPTGRFSYQTYEQ